MIQAYRENYYMYNVIHYKQNVVLLLFLFAIDMYNVIWLNNAAQRPLMSGITL